MQSNLLSVAHLKVDRLVLAVCPLKQILLNVLHNWVYPLKNYKADLLNKEVK